MNRVIYILLFLLSYSVGYGQAFLNSDLNGSVNFVSVPTNWQQIPDFDPICQANTPPEATIDILDGVGPNAIGGVAGLPFSGGTFCSGLHSTDGGAFLWHEGIMQTVAGFTIGNSYTVNFNQTVVKQQNALDESGSWRVYLDGILISTSTVSTSILAFDDLNLQWDCRSVTFTATAAAHTIKFIPWDDDANQVSSLVDITGGLRMGIDQIEFFVPIDPTITAPTGLCLGDPALDLSAAAAGGVWTGIGITDSVNGTFDPAMAGLGIHTITYTITTSCASALDSVTIIVGELDFTTALLDESCDASNGQITLTPTLGVGSYSFSINGGSSSQGSGIFVGLPAGNYDVVITDITTGCVVIGTETLINTTGPTIDSVVFIDPTCPGVCDGLISVYSPTATSYTLPSGTSNGTGIFNSVCDGTFDIVIEDVNGCSSTVSVTLTSESGSDAQFGFIPGYITPTENLVTLLNTSTGASSYFWEINGPDGFYDVYDYDINSYEFPSVVGAYNVCLIAVSPIGCSDTLCASIVMQEEFTIFIPNTFTPNSDEFNHQLVTYLNGIDDFNFEMKIYNRWGQVVFVTNDKNQFWDGTYNGKEVQDGSYNWKIVVKDPNQDERKEFAGHVNVIR